MRTLRIVISLALFSTLLAMAQFHPSNLRRTPNQANNVVRDYLRLDWNGGRLKPESWERMKPLTTWKENPDFQVFTIVSQYDVVTAHEGLRSAVVTVKYSVLGRFQLGVGYTPDPGSETVDFRVRDSEDGWRIEEQNPAINPHVSRALAVQWLQAALNSEKSPANKVAIEKALQTLSPK